MTTLSRRSNKTGPPRWRMGSLTRPRPPFATAERRPRRRRTRSSAAGGSLLARRGGRPEVPACRRAPLLSASRQCPCRRLRSTGGTLGGSVRFLSRMLATSASLSDSTASRHDASAHKCSNWRCGIDEATGRNDDPRPCAPQLDCLGPGEDRLSEPWLGREHDHPVLIKLQLRHGVIIHAAPRARSRAQRSPEECQNAAPFTGWSGRGPSSRWSSPA